MGNGTDEKDIRKVPHIFGCKDENAGGVNFSEIISALPKNLREKLTAGYDMKSFARIFEDGDMMRTADAFLNCGMNISRTARILYMHRNTLIYRLGVIRRQTGLDLRDFQMAVTFKILHYLYILK